MYSFVQKTFLNFTEFFLRHRFPYNYLTTVAFSVHFSKSSNIQGGCPDPILVKSRCAQYVL